MRPIQIKKFSINFSLFLCGLFVALTLSEVAARLFVFGAVGLRVLEIDPTDGLKSFNYIQQANDPDLIYVLRPNLNTDYRFTKLRTNSTGLREDREYSEDKPKNVKRVIALGDSFTMPAGIDLENSYLKILESHLNSRVGNDKYEVINFAVSGYSLRQYQAMLESKAIKYHPDLILVGWCAQNDHFDVHLDLEKLRNKTLPFYFNSILWRYLNMIIHTDETPDESPYVDRNLQYIREIFAKLKHTAGGVPVLIVNLGFNENNGPYLHRLSDEFGFDFIDTIPIFEGKRQLDYVLDRLDSHPNKQAQAAFADVIYKHWRDNQKF